MYESYEAILCHHGIVGQKWGVRRYQNEDGSLTALGAKHYSDSGLGDKSKGTAIYDINETGKKVNAKNFHKSEKHSKQILKELQKNKEFQTEKQKLKDIRKIDKETYDKEIKEWGSGKGKYKNMDYYQFKDTVRTNWANSKIGKDQMKSEQKIRDMANNIAKGKGLFNQSYEKMKDIVVISPKEGWENSFTKKVSYGEEAVNIAMSQIRYELLKD